MKSILFKPFLAEQIRKGNKTQTRRVIKPQPMDHHWKVFDSYELRMRLMDCVGGKRLRISHSINNKRYREDVEDHWRKPKYQIGETIYVKESFKLVDTEMYLNLCGCAITPCNCPEVGQILYRKENYGKYDKPEERGFKWTSALFMPEKYARTFLKITNVRVERLLDISEEDARAEGIEEFIEGSELGYKDYSHENGRHFITDPIYSFITLWDSINGKDPLNSSDANPWVFVYEFEKVDDK